jgi:hypothetical protein
MNRTICRALLLAAALSVPAAAQISAENLAASASARFEAFSSQAASAGFRPTVSPGMPRLDAAAAADFLGELRDSESLLAPASFRNAGETPKAELDLASLLNRHLKTSMRYQLSGRTVWFSGAFDASQNPYVSVLVDGAAPRYFNVKALLDNEQHLSVGGARYTLSLSPNIFHKMKSTINLTNDANSREAAHFSVQDTLEAVLASGFAVNLSGQPYKFYFLDGVDGFADLAGLGVGRMFVFIHGNSKDFHVFLIPENRVPSERMGVFTLFGGQRVALARRGGSLQVYENP